MDVLWKWLNIFLGLIFLQMCDGIPISLEESVTDKHTQLLTGLVAVLLTVCSIVCVAGCLCCHRIRGFKEFRDSPVVASASNLDHGHVNPVANGEFILFSPLSPPHYNNNIFLANEQIIARTSEDYICGDIDVSSWFSGPEKDFPRIKLKYIKELGTGWFGKVVEGTAKDLDDKSESSWTPVVVRILEATATHKERITFLHDAAIYKCGSHPNILPLLGRCLDTVPLLLLQEYCAQGDLKGYLRTKDKSPDSLFFNDYPLSWCHQLTSALKHLHDNKINHPDLATRNCQLTSDLMLKVGDYGLAVFKYPEDYYQGSPAIPVRWRSPESLTCTSTTIQAKNITPEDNVWSLGVTIWEICSCGEQPYTDLSDDEVISQVLGLPNVRLTKPTFPIPYVDYMYHIMQLCWTNIESRPTVSQVYALLTDLLERHQNTKPSSTFIDEFEQRWEAFKPNSIVKIDSILENDVNAESQINITNISSPSDNNLQPTIKTVLKDSNNQLSNDNHQTNTLLEHYEPSKVNFDLTLKYNDIKDYGDLPENVLLSQRSSSGSETEDENWRNKVERGAYTEKVRLKSKSAADLMVLTHVDYSESESETPLPSLDYRVNYKNVRYAPKNNLENLSFTYGSEGNLLNIQEKFQEELKQLREEHRDSLFFVPDTHSQSSFNRLNNNRDTLSLESLKPCDTDRKPLVDPSNKRLMLELNTVADIKPSQQIFNVFNVTIDKFKPLNLTNHKLNELINLNESNDYCKIENVDELAISKELKDVTDNSAMEPSLEQVANEQAQFTGSCINRSDCEEDTDYISSLNATYQNPICNDMSSNSVEVANKVCSKSETEDMEIISSTLNEHEHQTVKDESIEIYKHEEHDNFNIAKVHDNQQNIVNLNINDSHESACATTDNCKSELNGESDQHKSIAQDESQLISINNTPNILEFKNEQKEIICKENEYDKNQLVNIIEDDITDSPEDISPNSLNLTSTPFSKKENQPVPAEIGNNITALNLFDNSTENELHENSKTLINCTSSQSSNREKELTYSLETWDSFLGKSFDDQNKGLNENLFDSFSSDPHSILFVENEDDDKHYGHSNQANVFDEKKDNVCDIANETFLVADNDFNTDKTYVNDTTFIVDNTIEDEINTTSEGVPENCDSENETGWFLHPQISNTSDSVKTSSRNMPSYVGFGIDDEIMTAIRNELLIKLPHAQGIPSEKVIDADEWETSEKNEIFLKYNVYNPPLSPILEESYNEEISGLVTPKRENENEGSECSELCMLEENLIQDVDSHSSMTRESLYKGPDNYCTTSQESCCSNDTLFNLEELSCPVTENDKENEILLKAIEHEMPTKDEAIVKEEVTANCLNDNAKGIIEKLKSDVEETNVFRQSTINEVDNNESQQDIKTLQLKSPKMNETDICEQNGGEIKRDQNDAEFIWNKFNIRSELEHKNIDIAYCINEFIFHERDHTSKCIIIIETPHIKTHPLQETTANLISETPINNLKPQVAPLPSPEDNPWKQLPASMLNYDMVVAQNNASVSPITKLKDIPCQTFDSISEDNVSDQSHEIENNNKPICNSDDLDYVNCNEIDNKSRAIYENIENASDHYNEVDYVNIINLENKKNTTDYINLNEKDKYIDGKLNNEIADDLFGMLTDIRFNGPASNQLLPASFGENNDLNDEQEWDSGSDTRSSSSGEFIWKEGEHEESLKALQAVPQLIDEDKHMDFVEDTSDDNDTNSTKSDEEGETPEFVPSAWDKFATPTKSALRSPEKISQKSDKKAKGVWFKKQKYHCVYEYPREPESPVLQSQHLWHPHVDYKSFTDWEFDVDTYVTPSTDNGDPISSTCTHQSKRIPSSNLYQLINITDFKTGNNERDELYMSNSAKPLDIVVALSSQFFPGSTNWGAQCDIPEGGLEDVVTSVALSDDDAKMENKVQTLEKLALEVVNKNKQTNVTGNEVIGGLRHTRDKLKLDLHPSPCEFTPSNIFMTEPILETVVREKPTFTTFGKSRFLVQHIDTPPLQSENSNVSFEALPYKPLTHDTLLKSNSPNESLILKDGFSNDCCKESGRLDREECLLDSADEDSGIESCTSERKSDNILT